MSAVIENDEDCYGYIYCMWNEMYGKDSYKIGCAKNVQKRLKAYTTSYKTPVQLKYTSCRVPNYKTVEQKIFKRLQKYRSVSNREFFDCNISIIITEIDNITKSADDENDEDVKYVDNEKMFSKLSKENDIEIYGSP